MGHNALLLSCLVGSVVSLSMAAHTPPDKKLQAKDLAALWADLYKDDPAASRAVLKLFKHPGAAVGFLKGKLRPLKLDAARCRRLLRDLGSMDEKTWKAAW